MRRTVSLFSVALAAALPPLSAFGVAARWIHTGLRKQEAKKVLKLKELMRGREDGTRRLAKAGHQACKNP